MANMMKVIKTIISLFPNHDNIMSDKSISQAQKPSFSNVNSFWGFSPRSPQLKFLKPVRNREATISSNPNNSILSESISGRGSVEENQNDLSRLSVDISSILESCVSQSQNRTSSSSMSQQECSKESRSYVNINMQGVQVYLAEHKIKKSFLDIIRICLIDKFHNSQISSEWNCQNLFKSFSLIRLDHPFEENSPMKSETLESFFVNWIHHYEINTRWIISFDFLLSHLTLILILIFYWLHMHDLKENPLCSEEENKSITHSTRMTQRGILLILADYITLRSRDVKCNIISAKVLNQFYIYIRNQLKCSDPLVQQSQQLLQEKFEFQSILMENLSSSLEFSKQILNQIHINYFQKDKIIKDCLSDLIEVFNVVDMKAFINTPLSAYYDTEELKESKHQTVNRHTYLSCWLLKLITQATKRGGYLGIQYFHRYLEMAKGFVKLKNCESGLLFVCIVMTIRDHMPNLWNKYRQKHPISQNTFSQLLDGAQVFSFASFIPHKVKIFQRIQLAKQKFQGKYLSFRFHQTIYEIGRIVQRCKQSIQKQFKTIENKKNKLKINYNQSYIHHHIYEAMKAQCPNANELYESLKTTAQQTDKQIKFPLFGFSLF